MTLEEWLLARDPAPPGALADRLRDVVARAASPGAEGVPEACLAAAEGLLVEMLRKGCTARESALDLLAVDALVTYAFEAAGEDPQRLDERAADAMSRISALADVPA
jgi:hypothetical protein